MFRSFLKNINGNFAVVTAVVAPVMLGAVGLSIDFTMLNMQRSKLQEVVDATALASVNELSLAGSSDAKMVQVQSVAKAYAQGSFFQDKKSNVDDLDVISTIDPDTQSLKVDLSYTWQPFFAQYFDTGVTPIKVSATAKLAGESLTCVLGLMPPQRFAKASIHLDNNSIIKADRCAVFSNSTSEYGLRADGDAKLSAQTICSAGGVIEFGKGQNFSPDPITDCPEVNDPLVGRSNPSYGGCSEDDLIIGGDDDGVQELRPGVYCGGLSITGDADVELRPGVYVIKDGPFLVSDRAKISGVGVTFFLTGDGSTLEFQENTTIDIAAPEAGSTAGLLFFEDRSVNYSFDFNPFFIAMRADDVRIHQISSNNARNLLGTIYLSRSILLIDASAPVADASAYTAIITGRLWLKEGPILTLNADLTDTSVPVPDGLMGIKPVLVN